MIQKHTLTFHNLVYLMKNVVSEENYRDIVVPPGTMTSLTVSQPTGDILPCRMYKNNIRFRQPNIVERRNNL